MWTELTPEQVDFFRDLPSRLRLWLRRHLVRRRYAGDGRRRPHGHVPYRSPETEEKVRQRQNAVAELTRGFGKIGVTAEEMTRGFREIRKALSAMNRRPR